MRDATTAPPGASADAASLTALIDEQAAAEVGQVLADAQQRADAIVAAAEAEAQRLRAAAERDGAERGKRRAAELLARADAHSRMELLRAREALIDQALTQALAEAHRQLTEGAATRDGAGMLADLAREALPLFGPGPLCVRIPAHATLDAATCDGLGAGRWILHIQQDAALDAGVVVETADGRRRFDNSLAARMRRRHDRLRQLAATLLLDRKPISPQTP